MDYLELAQNVETDPQILEEIAIKGTPLEKIYVALNPNTPTDVLIKLANKEELYGLVLANPVMDILILENPNILLRFNLSRMIKKINVKEFVYLKYILNRCLETNDHDPVIAYIITNFPHIWQEYRKDKINESFSLCHVVIDNSCRNPNLHNFNIKRSQFEKVSFGVSANNLLTQESCFFDCVWGDAAHRTIYQEYFMKWNTLKSCLFKEAILKNCLFINHTEFSGCKFENVVFEFCDFTQARFDLCRFNIVTFKNCKFNQTVWSDSVFKSCRFISPDGELPPGQTAI